MPKPVLFTLLFCCFTTMVFAGPGADILPVEKRKYYTQKLNSPIKLDGKPDEEAWDAVEWGTDFVEYQPNENTPPSHQTKFKILYDERFLYIAFDCIDACTDSIVKRMGRRDEFPGDWVEVNIDAYHDLRTAFSFTTSVSGVRGDEFISSNGNNWDGNWNPIWYAKTHVNTTGWTGEIKIPFSQLRYGNEPEKIWGIQVQRRIFRKEERSCWQYIPQNSGVWVSAFGELHGLNFVPSQKQIELAPYLVAQTATYQKEEGNPFATGNDSKIAAGIDGKVAVTSDLILDFTVNPDFGQVEADPSQVRIDGFQNYFEERRPFFMESRNIFDYQLTGSSAGGEYDADLLFYSRRIGSQPHAYPHLLNGEYAKVPDKTSILGAAKFSGKTKKGWSIGVLESITQREKAEIDNNGNRHEELVEPLCSYFVGRLQKDINGGSTVLGGIITAVNREKGLDEMLHSKAYSGGLDFLHYWKRRTYYFKGNLIGSYVEGTPEAIYNTQTSIEHLFQRDNNTEARFDPNRTSLTGTAGTFKLGKTGGKTGKYGQVLKFETGVTWRSPELELNDLGFMLTADEINHFAWAGFMFQQPVSIFRNARISYNHWSRWDFSGQFLFQAFNVNTHGTFKNFWSAGTGIDWNPFDISNNALRGVSSIRRPPGMGVWAYLNSDSRKKIVASLNISTGGGFGKTVTSNNLSLGIGTQPLNALNISLDLGYNQYARKQDQFVAAADYNNGLRTIVSGLDQETLRLTLRLNYNITPDLTIQYYGQPFITRPLYKNYGYVKDAMNSSYDDRFHRFDKEEISFSDNTYYVDENKDGTVDYSFNNPDFNFVQFRSNLVLRWEYKPGSEFYLVWSQGNTPDAGSEIHSPIGRSMLDNMFTDEAKNIFLLKFTYRFLK